MSGSFTITMDSDKPWYASSIGRVVTVALFNIHNIRDEDFRVQATLGAFDGVPPTAEDVRQMLIMRRRWRRESNGQD